MPPPINTQGLTEDTSVTSKGFSQPYGFFSCKNCTINIDGKCSAVMLEGCQKVTLKVDTIVSGLEIGNCKNVKIIVKPGANLPSVMIDKTDGCHITLNEETQNNPDFLITAAKSSEMNLMFQHDGEFVEKPIPEQFVYKLNLAGSEGPSVTARVSDLYLASN